MPIVIFANETIDEDVFEQEMLMPYNKKPRVTWKFENNQYDMSTTKEDLCSSLLDIIANSDDIE
jgi:hypothetical protein